MIPNYCCNCAGAAGVLKNGFFGTGDKIKSLSRNLDDDIAKSARTVLHDIARLQIMATGNLVGDEYPAHDIHRLLVREWPTLDRISECSFNQISACRWSEDRSFGCSGHQRGSGGNGVIRHQLRVAAAIEEARGVHVG